MKSDRLTYRPTLASDLEMVLAIENNHENILKRGKVMRAYIQVDKDGEFYNVNAFVANEDSYP